LRGRKFLFSFTQSSLFSFSSSQSALDFEDENDDDDEPDIKGVSLWLRVPSKSGK